MTARTQWFNYGDHPAVRRPTEPHLQPVYGLKNCGILSTPKGDVLIREGDWIVTDDDGGHHVEPSSDREGGADAPSTHG